MLGARYSPAIDIWSVGCILWQMIEKTVLFPGDSEIGELYLIFKCVTLSCFSSFSLSDHRLLGTPSEALWPGVSDFPHWMDTYPSWPQQRIVHRLQFDPVVSHLLSSLLVLNPARRLTARNALTHPFLNEPDTTDGAVIVN